jgi:hypothetical protein
MSDAERYRRHAADCIRVAAVISSTSEKALLIQMAETWLRLAERAEGSGGGVDGGTVPDPKPPNPPASRTSDDDT